MKLSASPCLPFLGLALALLPVAAKAPVAARAQEAASGHELPSIEEKTEGLDKRDGFFPLYWDAQASKLYLEIERLGENFLYLRPLPAGLGSNDVGLDRGQLGGELARFLDRSYQPDAEEAPSLEIPPGSPIGGRDAGS